MKKSTKSSAKTKPFQISKEFFRGKWQRVGFFKNKKGKITIKPIR